MPYCKTLLVVKWSWAISSQVTDEAKLKLEPSKVAPKIKPLTARARGLAELGNCFFIIAVLPMVACCESCARYVRSDGIHGVKVRERCIRNISRRPREIFPVGGSIGSASKAIFYMPFKLLLRAWFSTTK